MQLNGSKLFKIFISGEGAIRVSLMIKVQVKGISILVTNIKKKVLRPVSNIIYERLTFSGRKKS